MNNCCMVLWDVKKFPFSFFFLLISGFNFSLFNFLGLLRFHAENLFNSFSDSIYPKTEGFGDIHEKMYVEGERERTLEREM